MGSLIWHLLVEVSKAAEFSNKTSRYYGAVSIGKQGRGGRSLCLELWPLTIFLYNTFLKDFLTFNLPLYFEVLLAVNNIVGVGSSVFCLFFFSPSNT